jgi:hypothetical protein
MFDIAAIVQSRIVGCKSAAWIGCRRLQAVSGANTICFNSVEILRRVAMVILEGGGVLKGAAAIVTPALSAALVAVAFLDDRASPLAWIGMTLWIAWSAEQPPYLAFRGWLLGGLVTVGISLHWFPQVAIRHLDVSIFTSGLVTALAVVWDAFRFGAFGYVVACLAPRGWRGSLVWPVV